LTRHVNLGNLDQAGFLRCLELNRDPPSRVERLLGDSNLMLLLQQAVESAHFTAPPPVWPMTSYSFG
jgi:hypothetical protein